MSLRRDGSLTAVLLALVVASPARALCPTSGEETVQVSIVEPRLELKLADGRTIRLVGLDPALQTPDDPDRADTARATLATRVVGHRIGLHPLSATPDRWGRIAALAFDPTGLPAGQTGDVALAAIADGLGRYRAEAAARPCRDELLAAEQKARAAGLGLWSDPYYAVLAVDDVANFIEKSGTEVLSEGRLMRVETGPFRTILRFAGPDRGSYGGHTLSATVLPRTMKAFEASHVDFTALIGRTLRFRGLLDLRFGPRIELDGPDAVEILPSPAVASPTAH
jgi:endonuclease YncB( thermonuclease family)